MCETRALLFLSSSFSFLKRFHGGFFAVAVAAQRNQVVHVVGSAVFQAHNVVHFVPCR